jgi:hypothetical protein
MDLINALMERRSMSVALIVLLASGAAGGLWYNRMEQTHAAQAQLRGWYTDDDGQTWFSSDKRLLSPFDHNGKPAYRAYVFSGDGGKTQFVGYMERYTPDALQQIRALQQPHPTDPPQPGVFERIARTGIEIKKPGQSQWVNISDPKAAAVKALATPTGGQVAAVTP